MAYLVSITTQTERDFLSLYEDIHAGESAAANYDRRTHCDADSFVPIL